MRVIEPIHQRRAKRSWTWQTGGSIPRKWILSKNGRWTVRSRLRTWGVDVGGNQLSNARPVALDILRHLADSGPVVIHNSRRSAHHRLVAEAISETKMWSEVGIGVVRDLATRVDYDVRRQGSRRQAGLSGWVARYRVAAGIQRDAGNTRGNSTHGAGWRGVLQHVRTIAVVGIASLDATLLA